QTDAANKESEQREQALDLQMDAKKENLARRKNSEEAYLDQAKKHHSEWAKAQQEGLKIEKEQLINSTESQIKAVGDKNNRRLQEIDNRIAGTAEKLNE